MFTPLLQTANTIISGKEEQIKLAVACLLSKGHLLIEDLPGMGKPPWLIYWLGYLV